MCLGCAHWAKFGDAVERALPGAAPPLPPELASLADQPTRVTPMANSLEAVQAFIAETTGR